MNKLITLLLTFITLINTTTVAFAEDVEGEVQETEIIEELPVTIKTEEDEDPQPEIKNGLFRDGGLLHYYVDGEELFGLINDNGQKYFINNDNTFAKEWKKVNADWYYFDTKNGNNKTGWIKWNNKWYYLDPTTGIMQTGWLKYNNKWYYLKPGDSGRMMTGWQKVNGYWYYMNSQGIMQTGWLKYKNKWYYLKTGNSGRMVTGWKVIGHAWYYMKPNGVMVTGKNKINGKTYTFDSKGRWIKSSGAQKALNSVGWDLKKAYNWSVKNISYQKGSTNANLGINHFASIGFNTRRGNCYSYAGTLYQMAKMLGYDVKQVSGTIQNTKGGTNPHSWLEIKIDGQTYVFDPDFEYETGRSGWMLSYDQKGWVKVKSKKYMKE